MKEEWRDIEGFVGKYKVSNYGRVLSLQGWNGHRHVNREKVLNPTIQNCKNDYKRMVVNLSRKTHRVHSLVAKAFLENPRKLKTINHKDCNPLNNRVDNLEWCTPKENVHHAIKNKRNKSYYYADEEKVIDLFKQGLTRNEIAERLDVTKSVVSRITSSFNINRKQFPRKSKYGVTMKQFKKLFESGLRNKEISEKYNIPAAYIGRRKYQIKMEDK